ncbi:hypothetical protein GCM10010495_17580 [Kitasatospora herbaricolor]|nr:hypothetical protein GCM10010495_17580 [Kitasatospora herbaricolor]
MDTRLAGCCRAWRSYAHSTVPRGKGAGLSGLQALAAAAKKKLPDTHDVNQPNPGPPEAEARPRTFSPFETNGCVTAW